MTTVGWIFMTVSLTFVFGLCAWCYTKVLSAPPRAEKPPAVPTL